MCKYTTIIDNSWHIKSTLKQREICGYIFNLLTNINRIPINCSTLTYILPYYENSPYKFIGKQDIDFLKGTLPMKPVSRNIFQRRICYIPSIPEGNFIGNIEITYKTEIINKIEEPFIIKAIYIYSKKIDSVITTMFNPNIYIIGDNINYKIELLPEYCKINDRYTIIKWLPIIKYTIKCSTSYEIDISNILLLQNDIYQIYTEIV